MADSITVNGDAMPWSPGMTVSDVLDARGFVFKLLVITVDGELVKRDRYDRTEIPAGAEVKVVHLMSGG